MKNALFYKRHIGREFKRTSITNEKPCAETDLWKLREWSSPALLKGRYVECCGI